MQQHAVDDDELSLGRIARSAAFARAATVAAVAALASVPPASTPSLRFMRKQGTE